MTTFALPARREHYYGGAWHASLSGAVTDVENPATGEGLGKASNGGERVRRMARHAGAATRRMHPGGVGAVAQTP